MGVLAYAFASFLSFVPEYFRFIILGLLAVLALWLVFKIVAFVLDAIPFL